MKNKTKKQKPPANSAAQHVPRIAVYPGSFDPITMGHVDIINRISQHYDQVIVLVAKSPSKSSLFTVERRMDLIKLSLPHLQNVVVDTFDGLTVEYMHRKKAQVIVRGLRAVVDFEYEMTMANMNKKLAPEFETMLVFARPEFYYISSRGVKEVASQGGNLDGLVPPVVEKELIKCYRQESAHAQRVSRGLNESRRTNLHPRTSRKKGSS